MKNRKEKKELPKLAMNSNFMVWTTSRFIHPQIKYKEKELPKLAMNSNFMFWIISRFIHPQIKYKEKERVAQVSDELKFYILNYITVHSSTNKIQRERKGCPS